MHRISLAIISLIMLSAFAMIPAAGKEVIFELGGLDDYNGIEERDLLVSQDTYSAYISSYKKDKEDELFFDFSITADRELWIGANYGRYNGDGFENSGMQVRFLGLIEYLDTNENGAYNPDTDEMISGMPLSGDFYYSDLVKAAGDYANVNWQDPNIWGPHDWNDGLMETYNLAFSTGWDLGLTDGEEDIDSGNPFDPDITLAFENPDIMDFLMDIINSTLTGLEEDSIYEAYEWAFTGLSNGYMMGYERGYGGETNDPIVAEPSYPETRSSETDGSFPEGYYVDHNEYPPGMDPGEMGLLPSKSQPIYDPIRVNQAEYDNGSEEAVMTVWNEKGIFGIKCKVSNMFSMIENGYLSPTSMKIDIMIEDYPYIGSETDIAVLMDWGVSSMSIDAPELEYHDESYYQSKGLAVEEEEYRMGSSSFKGFLSWVKYADCDGERKEVKVSSYNSFYGNYIDETGGYSENYKSVVITYPRSNSIYHDPKIGFIEIEGKDILTQLSDIDEISSKQKGNIVVFMVTVVVVMTFIGITWKRRGPSK